MRYLVAVFLVSLVVGCSDGGSTAIHATPTPPDVGLPPGIAGIDIGSKRFAGQTQISITSEFPLFEDFGPEQIDLEVAISGGNDDANAEHLASFFPAAPTKSIDPFFLELRNSDGELTFVLDVTGLCGAELVLEAPASINPASTINVAGLDVERSCQSATVAIVIEPFTLQESSP